MMGPHPEKEVGYLCIWFMKEKKCDKEQTLFVAFSKNFGTTKFELIFCFLRYTN